MNINKNSWHFKWWKFWGGDQHSPFVSLCGYVQRIFWGIVLALCVVALIIGFLCAIGNLFYQHPLQACITFGGLIGFMGLCFGVFALIDYLRHRDPKEPGVFMSWVRAKKDRVCPLLNFEEK